MLHSQGLPFPAPLILAKSSVQVSTAADTNENIFATITVPANALGANGRLRIKWVISFTNNANVKTFRVRYSGIAGTIYMNPGFTTQGAATILGEISNRALTNAQVGEFIALNAGNAFNYFGPNTSTVNTLVATTLVLTAEKATGSDTATSESYCVELLSDGT